MWLNQLLLKQLHSPTKVLCKVGVSVPCLELHVGTTLQCITVHACKLQCKLRIYVVHGYNYYTYYILTALSACV